MSKYLLPHGLQYARPPCPSPTPGAYSNSCPFSHPSISASVIPFSSSLQSFPASGSFPVSQFFTSGGQSFSFSMSPSKEYSGLISFRMDWFDLLAVQGALKSLLQSHNLKASILEVDENQLLLNLCRRIALCRAIKATKCRRNHQIPKNGTYAFQVRREWCDPFTHIIHRLSFRHPSVA